MYSALELSVYGVSLAVFLICGILLWMRSKVVYDRSCRGDHSLVLNSEEDGTNVFCDKFGNYTHLERVNPNMHVMIVIVMIVIKDFGREGGFHAHKYI